MRQCSGCDEELGQAIYYQDDFGLHYATSLEEEFWEREHFKILMVDDEGKIVIQ